MAFAATSKQPALLRRPSTEDSDFTSNEDLELEPLPRKNSSPLHSRRKSSGPKISHGEHRRLRRPTINEDDPEDHTSKEKYFEAYRANLSEQIRRDPQSLTLVPYADEDYGIVEGKTRFNHPPPNARAYSVNPSGRPLIDFIRNEWRHTTSDSSRPGTPTCEQVIAAPSFRRYLCIILLLLTMFLVNWVWWAGPSWREYSLLSNQIRGKVNPAQGLFGSNKRPEFRDMIQLKTIDRTLIPKKGGKARLIVIGDVHGCHEELVALLTEIDYNRHHDHVILAGDLVSKGPSSPAVVDLAISMRASCVRGNHEDRILLARRNLKSEGLTHYRMTLGSNKDETKKEAPSTASPKNQPEREVDAECLALDDQVDRELARSLSQKQIDYLAACPVILKLGHIRGLGEMQVVHAGLVPGISLEKQDPVGVMNMRTIDPKTHVPSRISSGTPWNKFWDKYQRHLPHSERSTVIYGHDSGRGLQLTKYTKGLDTGCVKGGKLTALIIQDGGKKKDMVQSVSSVRCRDYRV